MKDVANIVRTPFVVVPKSIVSAVTIGAEVAETVIRAVFGAGSHIVSEVNTGIDAIGAELAKLTAEIRTAVKGGKDA